MPTVGKASGLLAAITQATNPIISKPRTGMASGLLQAITQDVEAPHEPQIYPHKRKMPLLPKNRRRVLR